MFYRKFEYEFNDLEYIYEVSEEQIYKAMIYLVSSREKILEEQAKDIFNDIVEKEEDKQFLLKENESKTVGEMILKTELNLITKEQEVNIYTLMNEIIPDLGDYMTEDLEKALTDYFEADAYDEFIWS